MSHPAPPLFKDHAQHVKSIVRAALDASDPTQVVSKQARDSLHSVPCSLLAVGKASAAMTRGFMAACGGNLSRSVVIGPPGTRDAVRVCLPDSPAHTVYEADHPLPTLRNIEAAKAAAELARHVSATVGETLVVLLSGGASAYLALPEPPITLDDLRHITQGLLRAGANIHELNTVRKHLELLKGGGLARLASPAPVRAFILSDVMGDDLSTIASGPLVPDETTFADAIGVLARFGLRDTAPSVTARLEQGAAGIHNETLKPGDPAFRNVECSIIGSNAIARRAAADEASRLGFRVKQAEDALHGEARIAGERFAREAQSRAQQPDEPHCTIAGGETTVHVHGTGIGGRNQEFSLAAAIALDHARSIVIASFATDGVDGPTDAAGAYASGETCTHAHSLGHAASEFLNNNDSFTFFSKVGTLIRTGPTGTNVNDVAIALVYMPQCE